MDAGLEYPAQATGRGEQNEPGGSPEAHVPYLRDPRAVYRVHVDPETDSAIMAPVDGSGDSYEVLGRVEMTIIPKKRWQLPDGRCGIQFDDEPAENDRSVLLKMDAGAWVRTLASTLRELPLDGEGNA